MRRLVLSWAAALLFVAPAVADGPFRTVSLWHDPAPGTPGQIVRFAAPWIDENGLAIFWAQSAGTLTGNTVIYSETSPGVLSPDIVQYSHAPGTPLHTSFNFLNSLTVNRDGEIGISASLQSTVSGAITSGNEYGLWTNGSGTLDLLARRGDQAGSAPAGSVFGSVMTWFNNMALNAAGEMAFSGQMQNGIGGVTTTNSYGVWQGTPGALDLLVRATDQAPGTPIGHVFSSFGDNTSMNELGEVAFTAFLSGPGVSFATNARGVWSDVGGTMQLIARQGDVAPDTSGGVFTQGFSDVMVNTNGVLAFSNNLQSGVAGVTSANDSAVWRGAPGSLEVVAREGDQAPGTAIGSQFGFTGAPVLNANNDLAFRGSLVVGTGDVTAANDNGLWIDKGGVLDLVVREGDPVPGVPGAVFTGVYWPNLNDAGQLAFLADIAGPGVTPTTAYGVWAQRPDGSLAKVVRPGDIIDIDDGPGVNLKTVAGFNFNNGIGLGNDIGRSQVFNSSGQLALMMYFDQFATVYGDSGIFVWDGNWEATVPEPSTWIIAASAALGFAGWRRRAR